MEADTIFLLMNTQDVLLLENLYIGQCCIHVHAMRSHALALTHVQSAYQDSKPPRQARGTEEERTDNAAIEV